MKLTLIPFALILTSSLALADTTTPAASPAKPAATKASKGKKAMAPKAALAATTAVTKDDGLVVDDVKVGTGSEAQVGSRVKVHYKGTFLNGKVFDTNMSDAPEKIQPFTLDKDHLIAGWVEGIPGMKVGGVRKLKVPYKLAYGENGTPDGSIPPRADLQFEVELLKVE